MKVDVVSCTAAERCAVHNRNLPRDQQTCLLHDEDAATCKAKDN
jgi:hypothetical protein